MDATELIVTRVAQELHDGMLVNLGIGIDRKSTRLNSSHYS